MFHSGRHQYQCCSRFHKFFFKRKKDNELQNAVVKLLISKSFGSQRKIVFPRKFNYIFIYIFKLIFFQTNYLLEKMATSTSLPRIYQKDHSPSSQDHRPWITWLDLCSVIQGIITKSNTPCPQLLTDSPSVPALPSLTPPERQANPLHQALPHSPKFTAWLAK